MVISEITGIAIILFIAQVLLLPAQLLNYLQLRVDRTRLRFLLLALSFFAFNVVWLTQRGAASNNTILSLVLIYSGLFLLSHLYSYLTLELGIETKRLTPIRLFFTLSVIEAFRGSLQIIVNEHYLIYTSVFFFILFQLIALLLGFNILRQLFFESHNKKSPIEKASVISIVLILFLPTILFYVKVDSLHNLVLNSIFTFVAFAYFRHHFVRLQLEKKMFPRQGKLGTNLKEQYIRIPDVLFEYDLTDREKEISIYLLQGMSYEQIADKIFRSSGAIRKQASKAFAKAGVKNLKEFRKKFEYHEGKIIAQWNRKQL